MIVKCKNNPGVGDCIYRLFCLASLNDRSITGCNLPFVWAGITSMADAIVVHTVKEGSSENDKERSTENH